MKIFTGKFSNKGFIYPTLLFILSLSATCIFSLLNEIVMFSKITKMRQQGFNRRMLLVERANKLILNISSQKLNNNNEIKYLGSFPCVQLKDSSLGSHHYFIKVSNDNNESVLIRYITPDPNSKPCLDNAHVVDSNIIVFQFYS